MIYLDSSVALAYLLVAAFLMGCARFAAVAPTTVGDDPESDALAQAAPAE